MNNILTQNKLVKNLRAYPVLRKRWRGYIRGVRALPEGFTEDKLFHDYLRVRRSNPEKRVSMSEYMIFGFYGLTTAQQKQYLTDVEATLLMRPYNSIAEPYLKSKVTFLKNFTQFVSRGWLYLPESDPEAFDAFVHRYHVIALKPQYSSWGIGFRKLTEAEWDAAPDRQALFDELCAGKYLAEEFVQSDDSLARMDLRLCRQRVLGADHDHARVCARDAAGELGIEHDAEAGEHGHVQPSLGQRGEETPVAAELKRERRLRIQPVILADLRDDRPQLICPGITDTQIRRRAERGLSALRHSVVIADEQLPALPVKHLARRRQTHAALAAHEQRIAKLLLQQLDLLADCRLRDALLLGGTGKIEVLCSR